MYSILVKNIYQEYDYTEEIKNMINRHINCEIYWIFSQFGEIINSDTGIDSYNSTKIWYEKINECEQAILEMNGKMFRDKKLNVTLI